MLIRNLVLRMGSAPRALLASRRVSRRLVRVGAVLSTVVGCLLVAVGSAGLTPRETVTDPTVQPTVQPTAGATAGSTAEASAPAGTALEVPASQAGSIYADREFEAQVLRAGDVGGGAVTYLSFDVPRRQQPLDRALIHLTSTQPRLPRLVELVVVPDADWQEADLSWADAPLFGRTVRSVQPEPSQHQLAFDVTDLVAQPGRYAFAVTVPPDLPHAEFAGRGEAGEPVLRLSWATPAPIRAPVPPTTAASTRGRQADAPQCVLGELLVPTCGALWGVAPDAHTGSPRAQALARFEQDTGRRQHIYHAYHRGRELFPTQEEVEIAADGRLLFLNWKPRDWTWAQIADGHPEVDSHLDRLAKHIRSTFTEPFFLTIHHEPENDVQPRHGSGWEATDYAAMFRYVVQRLRGAGVDNLVTVVNYMSYVPWNVKPWFDDLYPGDEVVDWVAWNAYAYSDPGYGYGDFAELANRRSGEHPTWPGFYTWAATHFPDKPLMVGEWGVWYSDGRPGHMAEFYDSVARQTRLLPRLAALVYFDTRGDQRDRDSRPTLTEPGLAAYQRLGAQRYFQVQLGRTSSDE